MSLTLNSVEIVDQNKKHGIQVIITRAVIKLLNDDNKGSCHQTFILRLTFVQTLLIARNIDLAAPINSISKGWSN